MEIAKRQRNQRGDGGRLKEELVEAAMRILDRQPHSQLSLRMVAKEAGVAAPSVYMQFPDAQAMRKEISHECWRQIASAMKQSLPREGFANLFETVQASVHAYVRYAMERPSRYQLLFDLPGVFEADFDGPVQPVFRVIAATVEQMARENQHLPLNGPFPTTLLILSIAHGRIALAHTAPRRRGNSTASVQDFVRIALNQLFGVETPSKRDK